jgi:hypothetical protein
MTDIFSIISAGYANPTAPSRTAYKDVDPKAYQGSWQGKYSDNTSFRFDISHVAGFKAQVKYISGSDVKYQQVLIKDGAFKIGNSKFTLQKTGHAQVKTVVVNPATGAAALDTAYATKS